MKCWHGVRSFRALASVRVRGGVLQLTLGISVIIAVLCSAIILLAYYSRLSMLTGEINTSLRDNANSGIQYLMATRETSPFFSSQAIDLFDEGIDSVVVTRLPWGLFEVYCARASRASHAHASSAIITGGIGELTASTLYIPENNATVYLAGKAQVSGIVRMSERQFSSGSAAGRYFEGKRLLNGRYLLSESRMPALDTVLLKFARQWLEGSAKSGNLSQLDMLPPAGAVFSFSTGVINILSQPESIEIRDSLQGNIVIHSGTSVKIYRGAYLSDVIILAPKIEIEEGFEGRGQFIAEKSVTVGENVKLAYPSALAVLGMGTDSLIQISKGSVVEGVVVIPGYGRNQDSNAQFRIESGAALHGVAYINAWADVQGSIRGHLTTKRVQAKVDQAVYYNVILDADLSFERKSPDMPASLLWGNGPANVVARWVE